MRCRARGAGILAGAAMAVALSGPAAAYYHFTTYTGSGSPYQPIQAKFDLTALPNKTLTFYVSDNGPSQYSQNDSFASVLGAFQQAIAAWNAVSTSDLRLAFGGLYSQNAPSNAPVAQIIFSDDIAPGIVEMAGPTLKRSATTGPNGQFIPIVASQVLVPRNLAQRSLVSSNEGFFTTVVHEVGHALGLQHTWTSSTMSTGSTRATSHARPIDTDDVAGITLLYPKAGALAQFGSIAGRVLSGGQGVHLASVVALRSSASGVSTLTQPDGSYRIDGLPSGTYWVYVHPLPPAVQSGLGPGDIVLPLDNNQRPVQASSATETLFFPGTRDPNSFVPVQVAPGLVVNLSDINVQSRPAPAIHDVSSYSYFGSVGVQPAFVNANVSAGTSVVANGPGLINGNSLASGLGVQVLGGLAAVSTGTYAAAGSTYLVVYVYPNALSPGSGPRHLYFTLPNDAYVLPNGLNLVQKQPPSITSVNQQVDGSVVITGASIAADSKVYFDSLPAVTRSFSGNDSAAIITVVPPLGSSGQVSAVAVYNSDGQNSTFIQPAPPTFTYAFTAQPSFAINPPSNVLPAGTSAMIDITGINTNFISGQTTLGIGSSDITVQRVWVLSPTHLWANVSVAGTASSGAYAGTVMTGFQWSELPFSFQVTGSLVAAGANRPNISLPLATSTGQTTISPGATVSLFGSNLSVSPTGSGITLTLNGQPVNILSVSANQITFVVPAATPLGPSLLALNNGAADAFPVVVEVDNQPPVIAAVLSSTGQPVDATHPDSAGDIISIVLQNLDATTAGNPSRVHLNEGSLDLTALAITPFGGQAGLMQAEFALSPSITSQQVQLVVTQDGVASNAVTIAIR